VANIENINEVKEYLDKAKIFYLSTVDGDKPKCRPFGFNMVYDGKLWFGAGTFKNCYKQMIANPNVEIVATDGRGFLRYYGKAVFDDNPEIFEEACKAAPYIPKMYNDETGHKLGMFYLSDATAEFCGLNGIEKSLEM